MSRVEAWWERLGRTRAGRIVTHTAFLGLVAFLALAGAAVAVTLVVTQQGRQTDIARHEARVAVAKVERLQAQRDHDQQAQRDATVKVAETTRRQLCQLVRLNAEYAVPPQLADGWAQFGTSPLVHCGTFKLPPD